MSRLVDALAAWLDSDEISENRAADVVREHAAEIDRLVLPFEPPHLRELVDQLGFWPGWEFWLALFREGDEVRGWAFYVVSDTLNSFDFSKRIKVRHEFLVPPASWNRDTWAAWLFDRMRDVGNHETGEAFRINGVREFAPHHGNGEDPYRVWHVSDWATADKSSGDD